MEDISDLDGSRSLVESASSNSRTTQSRGVHSKFSVPETDESNSSVVVSDSELSFVPPSQAVASLSPKKLSFTHKTNVITDTHGVVEESSDDSVVDDSLINVFDDKCPQGKPYVSSNKMPSNSRSSIHSSIVTDTRQSLSIPKTSPGAGGSINAGHGWPTTPRGSARPQHAMVSTPALDPATPAGRWRESVIAGLSDDDQESPVNPLRKSNIHLPDEMSENELEYLLQNSNHSSSKMSTPKHFMPKQTVRNMASAKDVSATDKKRASNSYKSKNTSKQSIVTSLAQDNSFDESPVIVKQKRRPCVVIGSDDEDHDLSITINNTSSEEADASIVSENSVGTQQDDFSVVHKETDASYQDVSISSSTKYGGKYVIKKKGLSKAVSPCSVKSSNISIGKNSMTDVSVTNKSLDVSNSSIQEIQSMIDQKKKLVKTVDLHKLPDKGERIKEQISELGKSLSDLSMNSSIQDSSISQANSREASVLSVSSSSETESPHTKLPTANTIPVNSSNVYRYEPPPSFSPEKLGALKQEKANDAVADIKETLERKKKLFKATNLRHLPDNGEKLKKEITDLERELMMIELKAGPTVVRQDTAPNYEQKPLEKLTNVNTVSVSKGGASADARYLPPNMPQHVIDALYAAEHNYGGRDYGGKISHAREREMVRVTSDTLEHFTDMIKSMPDVDNLDPNEVQEPRGLKVDLMPHQKRALAWLLWRESQDPPGGILADDMGLGKTLTMLSLILRHRELLEEGAIQDFAMKSVRDEDEDEDESVKKTHGWLARSNRQKLKKTQATLVVCPASLIGQWEREAHERVSGRRLSVLVYHGTKRDTSLSRICQHDVVVTTYQLAMKEAFGKGGCSKKEKNSDGIPHVIRSDQGSLYQIGWARIILDEAHIIRNHKSQTAQAMCMLKGGRRWIVTGTPVQNKEKDVFSLIRFLRIAPFDDYTCWKHQIENSSVQGMRRLTMIVKAILLRRTKDQVDKVTGEQLVKLPEKTVVEHKLCLSQEERQIYDRVFTFSKNSLCEYMKSHEQKEMEKEAKTQVGRKVPVVEASQFTPTLNLSNFVDSGIKTHHLLVLLLRLRQICCHPTLIKAMVGDGDEEENHDISNSDKEGLEVALLAQLQDMTLQEVDDIKQEAQQQLQQKFFTLNNPVFDPETTSSKIERIIEELVQIKQKGRTDLQGNPDPENGFREKAVIVSQWTSMLQIVRDHLKRCGMKTHIIDGTVPVKDRTPIVTDFNNNPKGPKVLLLSLGAGGVGLNLIGANHLFLLDMHWNPQLEAQACDRIYRVGQTRPVFVHRFVVENTVEMKILELQKKKLQLAEDVLSGAKRRGGDNKLTLNDLKDLFNVA